MSETDYIYAGTRAKTLERAQLSDTQVELLTSAKTIEETERALHDTYLAEYLSRQTGESINDAIDQSLIDAKRVLISIAPQKELLDILWLEYDFYNLKTIIKGRRVGVDDETILGNCFSVGSIEADALLSAFDDERLGLIQPHFARAVEETKEVDTPSGIDAIINQHYFATILEKAHELGGAFAVEFVQLLIDLFNVKAALRAVSLPGLELDDVFISGGRFSKKWFETNESIKDVLISIGDDKHWGESMDDDGTAYTTLEKRIDDFISIWLRDKSTSIFTPAALYSYFYARVNNAQIITAILTAKRAGMTEVALRKILREIHQ